MVQISLRRLDPGLPLPSYAHPGDAGADLHAAVDVTLQPGERALVPTGIALALPEGHVGLVHPRSGLAARHGISIVNAPGTVDAGYRGEVQVLLVNTDPREPFAVRRGDRIAQLVVQRVETATFVEVDDLPASGRGAGGYGSTGGFAGASATPRAPQHEPAPRPDPDARPEHRRPLVVRFRRKSTPASADPQDDRGTVDGADLDAEQDADLDAGAHADGNDGANGTLGDHDVPVGPWDVSEVDLEEFEGIDLGSLFVAPLGEVELRLQVDEESGEVIAAVLVGDQGALELRGFAASRGGGSWDELRPRIAEEIGQMGGQSSEQEGSFGTELLCLVPVQTEEGEVVTQAHRVVAHEGPNWLLRATFMGQPAVEPATAGLWEAMVRQTVVRRGRDAMPPGSPLRLTLPPEARRVD